VASGRGRKVHLGIDAQTLEIQAIEITDNAVGDAPMVDATSIGRRKAACRSRRMYWGWLRLPRAALASARPMTSSRRSHCTGTSCRDADTGTRALAAVFGDLCTAPAAVVGIESADRFICRDRGRNGWRM